MLTAVGIASVTEQTEHEFLLQVDVDDAPRALGELARYAQENRPRAPAVPARPLHDGAVRSASVAIAALVAVAGLSTRGWLGRDWYAAGVLDGASVRAGAWWRALTALTLHADLAHLAANAGFGAVFGGACAALYGPGVGWLLILTAAVCANLCEASWMPAGMSSLGASTGVFAALGLVTARGRAAAQGQGLARGLYGALVAGALLLALLGTGDAHTDILGHALGFALGLAPGLALRGVELRSRWLDRACAALALAAVPLGWLAALAA